MATPDSPDEQKRLERLRQAMYSRTLSDQLRARERRQLDPSRPIVGDDFVRPETSLAPATVAPRGIGFARRALTWALIVSIVFFVGAIGFFAYYFTLGGGALSASASNIDIAVSGPPQVEGGDVTSLQVVITNRNSVPLDLADLVVTYPPGTRSTTDFSTPLPTTEIDLGTIAPGESRQGEISAVFSGVAGQQEDVKVELQYHLAGSNSVFIASSDYGITFGSSPLSMAVDGNSQTVSGQPVQFTVTVSSNASEPVNGALLSVSYPFGFTLTSATPPAIAPGLWSLGDLNAGGSASVTLQGVLTGDPGDTRTFNLIAGTSDGTSSSSTAPSITTPLSSESYAMDVTSSFLTLGISVGGASTSTSATEVSPGQTVPVAITYVNNLPTSIQNAVIVANISGAPIDGSKVLSSDGFYRSTDGSMLWNNTTDSDLASIPAGGSGTLKFSFEAPTSAMLANTTNPQIVISVSAAGTRTDQSGVPQNLQDSASQTIGIASDLELAAQGLYYSDPFGSSGPMPPQAGTETTYAIVFTVTNTTNAITDAHVTATLPPTVRWLGSYVPASENVSFNENTGTLDWDLGTIAPGAGENGAPPRQVAIAVGFTPSTSQVGSQPALMQQISLTGTDASTSALLNPQGGSAPAAPISLTVPDVTTNLEQISESSSGMALSPDPGFTAANATVVAPSQ